MTDQKAVLLMAYGGLHSLDDVEAYLLNVRGGRATPPELVAEIRSRYAAIGGRSPLFAITCQQAQALEARLSRSGAGRFPVFAGMRHWAPYIREVVRQIHAEGLREIIPLCMTPFASPMTTGAYSRQLTEALEEFPALQAHPVVAWDANPLLARAFAGQVAEALAAVPAPERESVQVVFTAHSLPAARLEPGDPYTQQFAGLAKAVAQAANLPEHQWRLSYQSAGAQNGLWLGPALAETLSQLQADGQHSVLVVPIGFLCDHVEILFDLDIEAQALAQKLGMHLYRTRSLNTHPGFIQALAEEVLNVVE